MKAVRLVALAALASAGVSAQQVGAVLTPPITAPGSGSLYPTPMPRQHGSFGGGFRHGRDRGFGSGGFIYYEEPYVVHDVVVVHDEPAPASEAAPPPEPPREPWVLGRTYASLPSGCLKLIQGGDAYFLCSGDWYRQVGSQFKAVARP